MAIDLIKDRFSKRDFNNQDNKVYMLGELLGIEEEGLFNGIPHDIVLMRTERERNKPLFIWVVFPHHEDTRELILRGNKVFIEGYMGTSYTFNNKAVSHTFVVPEEVHEVKEDIVLEKSEEFYLNYTVNNRVILDGVINNEPWREFIPPANNYVTRFSIDYQVSGKVRPIYCTVWDTVNDIDKLEKGQRIKVVGSFNLLKKERGLKIVDGVVVESRKNKLDSYVVVVQRIELVGEDEIDKKSKSILQVNVSDEEGDNKNE